MDTLTPALRRAYWESKLTYAQIAARADISENTVARVMGGRNVTTLALFKVCRVLGVSTLPVPPAKDEGLRAAS